jgi:hypothetical protein
MDRQNPLSEADLQLQQLANNAKMGLEKREQELLPTMATVFRIIDKKEVVKTLENGVNLRDAAEKDSRGAINQRIEEVFEQALEKKLGKKPKFSRKTCIYAFPHDPRKTNTGYNFDSEHEKIILMNIDPRFCIVVDSADYTIAYNYLSREISASGDQNVDIPNLALYAAEDYWNKAISLSEYLEHMQNGTTDELEIRDPEVLIFAPIDRTAVKLVDSQP